MTLAGFIELIAKIKQKNNGNYPLVDAEDIECEDGKRLNIVLNEKLNKNQGKENVGKTMVVGPDGIVIPVEMSGGVKDYNDLENKPSINGVELKGNVTSEQLGIIAKNDNFLYDDVAKQLNPNVTDSFQRVMWNLKMYGKSTQITTTGAQLIDELKTGILTDNQGNLGSLTSIYKTLWLQLDIGSYTFGGNAKFRIIRICKDGGALENRTDIIEANKPYNIEITQKNYLGISFRKEDNTAITDNDLFMLNKGAELLPYEPYSGGQPSPSPEYKQDVTAISQFSGQVNNGSEQSQPFTYIPTNPMYSTQDGSIADYVDVEKGVEVYNMKKYVVTGNERFFQDYQATLGYYGRYFELSNGVGTATTEIFCNYLPFVPFSWSVQKIGCCQNSKYQIHLKFDNETLGITDDTPVEEKRTAFSNYLKQLYANENPLYVVAVVTPTEIPIPQEQLQMLRILYTYNGVTNFLCNAPVSFSYEISQQINRQNVENRLKALEAKLLLQGGN